MGDEFFFVHSVEDGVRVVLQGGCEDDHFEVLGHFTQEHDGVGTDFEVAVFVVVVDQGLIQVQDQSVS